MAFAKNTRLLCVLLLLASCGTSDPEAAIRANIAYMQEAVEAREAGAAVGYLAEHFTGSFGTDKRDLRRLLAAQFLQHKHVTVTITRLDISVNEYNPVTARMEAVVIVTGAEGLLPRNGELIDVTGDWELHDGEWLLVSAQWE
ncbi:MAG TPA: hypothetical protein VFX02_04150 [Gammaproteobacteria bacterium]|nr:hypothetical protein [Gammaproteobacteria bacterium]